MKTVIFSILSLFSVSVFAQLINKGDVKIMPGTTFYIGVDFTNDNGTSHTWSNDGTVVFKGDKFTNDGTMDSAATGTTEFSGSNEQEILGSSTVYFHDFNVNNTSNSVLQKNTVDTDNMMLFDGSEDFDYKVYDGYPLYVENSLATNGDLRLINEAQLIQTHSGTTSNSGLKYIWIDQQGTTNQYWYNYWSSPVNRTGEWKMMYLKDGATGDNDLQSTYPDISIATNTNATSDINNTGGSHPVTLNSYWVFAFKDAPDNSYQGWYDNHIQHNGSLSPGEGYTMKGPGVDAALNAANGSATTDYESWTFAGFANDGDYSLSISAGNDYLVGNPYPSALDADQFIKDHVTAANGGTSSSDIFNGTLYFWEHTGGNDHYGSSYQGGYATYNLTGGTAAVDYWGTSTVGTKTPKQYIPVGQGFFIWAESGQGGTVTFNNAQRAFKTESAGDAVFIRPATDLINIRLGFDTPLSYHRQLLLGVRPTTTFGIDAGWDGPNFDADFPGADMYWDINNKNYIIQAIPQLSVDTRLPLNVVVNQDGIVKFSIDEVTNLPADIQAIYIEDNDNQSYHRVDNGNVYEVYLQQGNYDDRFTLTFTSNATNVEQLQLENIVAYYDNHSDELVILNANKQDLNDIKLYALTGQEVFSYDKNTSDTEIRIPLQLTTGVYLLNITSVDNKMYATKILIK